MHKVKRKFRFYPTEGQKRELEKVFGCVRFVYNSALDWRKTQHEEGLKPTFNKSSGWLTEFKKEKEFLKNVSCVPLQQSLRHLQTAHVRFFKKQSGFPKFKSKSNRQTAEFTKRAFKYSGDLSLTGIGRLSVVWTMKISNPTTVTVIKESGQYFVSLTVLESGKTLPVSNKTIGIDLGIETFATLSTGKKFKAPDYQKLTWKVKKLQRALSKKQKGSKRRERARLKASKAFLKVVNVRQDFLHKISTQLVRENQTIAIEDLSVSGMLKNKRLSRCISEQGWRTFRNMLEYKCEWYGRELIVRDRYFASSQTCNACGEKTKLTLDKRSWSCKCGTTHDRDVNAAKNLAVGQIVLAQGENVSPSGGSR